MLLEILKAGLIALREYIVILITVAGKDYN